MATLPLTLIEPSSFSLAERLVFIVLIAVSGTVFWMRLRPIARNILRSKRDPDLRLFPLGGRIANFVWEVLLQAKVIQQRPLPGIAHAFVFWAFLAFALVTLNHCAVGLGVGFLDPRGWAGRCYFTIAAAFAAACALSIVGLFMRRFIVRPRWLGKPLSWESGLIALLIFALMATYLASFQIYSTGLLARTGLFARLLWWAHTVALLVFLPLIPRTKHLHLLLSPFAVFLSHQGFSRIPPLVGDEDFGLVAGTDLTQIATLQAYSCVECGRCSEHCPTYNTGKILNPKDVILGLRGYLNAIGPSGEEPLLGAFNSQEAVFQCTTCGACEFQCPVGIEHLPLIIGLRRGAVNTGTWQDDAGGRLFSALERGSNALGLPSTERDKFIERQGLPIFDGTQEYCLWLGCMGAYDPQGRAIVSSLVQVMQYLGVTFGVLRKERCTGDPVRRLGNDLLFQQLAESNLETLQQNKVKKIITICPHCVRTIQEDWKEYGLPPAVEHHSEFMARYRDRLPQQSTGETIVFHDPCYLGRYRKVFDAPRAAVALAGELVEPPRSHERSFCCGAGGGLAFLGEESGERISQARAEELIATGAQTVGTACPFCHSMLRDALASSGEAPPQLLDIAQLVARGLPMQRAVTDEHPSSG